jgi:ribonuclease HII
MKFKEVKRLISLCAYEDELYLCGYNAIAGVDEAGRGSLAGPIVAAAVILDRNKILLEKLNDSKKLTARTRDSLFRMIIRSCKSWSVARVSSSVIDRISLGKSNQLVMKKTILYLKKKPDIVITDALALTIRKYNTEIIPIINGDELSSSIAAASVIAKVIRDRLMLKYSRMYPEYGFADNKGYGTRKHLLALQKYGPCRIHRVSFRGVLN